MDKLLFAYRYGYTPPVMTGSWMGPLQGKGAPKVGPISIEAVPSMTRSSHHPLLSDGASY